MNGSAAPPGTRKRRLGELLLSAGLIDEARLGAALKEQQRWGGRLGRTVVELGFVSEGDMVRVLGQQLRLAVVELDNARLPERITEHLRLDLAERYGVFPVGWDPAQRVVTLATSDPTNLEAVQELEFATNAKVQLAVATASGIERAIRRYYFGERTQPAPASAPTSPASPGVTETAYELDNLLGLNGPSRAPRELPTPAPQSRPPSELEMDLTLLRRELRLALGQVETQARLLESQGRALKALAELLIEAGLLDRSELSERLGKP